MNEFSFNLQVDTSGDRVDLFLTQKFPDISRSKIQKYIKDGSILVEGEKIKPSLVLSKGEQLIGTIGFDGMSTNMYHEHRPTMVKEIVKQYSIEPKVAKANNIQSYRFRGFQVPQVEDYLESRKVFLTNSDCNIILAAPKKSTESYFYKYTYLLGTKKLS